MQLAMHKIFISYHHANDQWYKEELLRINDIYGLFIDGSVDTGGINDDLPDERIRQVIRDDYLRDTTVTIVLCGTETAGRKHIDWEIYSSMFDGQVNKKSGVLVVNLPSVNCNHWHAGHGEREKQVVYPDYTGNWTSIDTRSEYQRMYPYIPDRIVDNLLQSSVKLSVVPWDRFIGDPGKIRYLVDATYNDKSTCRYDLSRPMRRANS